MEHKAGFVNIVGNPNVGKSTLMNALVGERMSIITAKAQTTRHRIMGIVNGDHFQIVYSDTPGILQPQYKLHESMMSYVNMAMKDADLFLVVTEIGEMLYDRSIMEKIAQSAIPTLLLINKIDLSTQQEVEDKIAYWKNQLPLAKVIPISAKEGFNIQKVFDEIVEMLPCSPPYFPKEDLTDRPVRFFVSEMVREKIMLYYRKEIPYSVEVVVDQFVEQEDINRISILIYVERESQKAILIGHQGKAIKKVGIEARKDIEAFTGKKCFMEMHIKVMDDWRDSERILKKFGYEI